MTRNADKDVPKVLDPNDLQMHQLASGVRVNSVGEDGDVMLMGHHEDVKAFALFAEWKRYYDGDTLTWEDSKVYDIERKYATFSDHSEGCEKVNCGCEDDVCEPCRTGKHDGCDGDSCECAAGYDHDFAGPFPCTCECFCDEYAWWVIGSKAGHEVTWVRWSWAKSKALTTVMASTKDPS